MTSPRTGMIAILRGLPTNDAAEVGRCLYEAGFRMLEVPFNSPDPLGAIRVLRETLPDDVVVGAGTVLDVAQVHAAQQAGAQIIVSPNTDTDVIAETVRLGMRSYPGVATASEGFRAIRAGARALKLFPAGHVGIPGMKAWMDVMPPETEYIPVGGINAANIAEWVAGGATGFGIGSSLYRPDRDPADLAARAGEVMAAWRAAEDVRAAQARHL
jgi:2-dehydro-3-deoxyphosphogalactonate aldolase